jgi:carboxylate-amine ligase
VIPHAFGEREPLTLGIEEELFVVGAESLEPEPVPPEVLDGERCKAELFRAVVELTTGACASVEEVQARLEDGRTGARRRAAEAGLALAASGTWPSAVPEEQAITPEPGYLEFVEYAGPSARRQFCSGLHVHVGVRSPEACMAALERVLPWLPVVLSVSANSPYLAGEETGLASTRAELLALLPRSGAPPVFDSYADWERFAERLVELGLADRFTRIWWDVRPHPQFGTLEVRAPDQPTRLEVTVAFAALVQALVATESASPDASPADRGLYAQNRWAALRFGARAALVHPDGGRLVPAPELLAELLERVTPAAERLGGAAYLGPLEGLAQADEQVEHGRREGLRSLCGSLVAAT